jgi:alkaline phosphatase
MQKVDLRETLIIVTADHSHTFFIQGYPIRGNNILGLVREVGNDGRPEPDYKRDRLGLPFTTIGYANGLGYSGPLNAADLASRSGIKFRRDLSLFNILDPNYLQEAGIPLVAETHGGEDVAIFATGPGAYLIRGSMEQNWIFHVMADAFRFPR